MENDLFGGDGPHGIGGVLCVGGEVPEGLAVVQPRLFDLLGGVGVIWDGEVIRLGDAFVPLLPEFLPRLGVDEFLQLCLEDLLWGLLVAFWKLYGFPRLTPFKARWNYIKLVY